MSYRLGRPRGTMRNSRERGDPRKFNGYGLFVWLNQTSGFTAATGVWLDASGNSKDTTPQSATRPTAGTGINGLPTVTFAGSANQALVIPATTFGTFTLFLVVKLSGTAGYLLTLKDDGGADGGYMYGSTGQTVNVHKSTTLISGYNLSANWAVDGAARSVCWAFNGHASHKLYLNGISQTLSSVSGNGDSTGSVSQPIYIGASDTGTAPTTGDYGEVIGFTGQLGQSEVTRLSNRSRAIWGT